MKFKVQIDAPFVAVIKLLAFYLLPFVVSLKLSEYSGIIVFLLRILLCSAFALFIVCAIHEIFHALFFRIAGATVKSIKIGVLMLSFRYSSPQQLNAVHPFTGCCTVELSEKSDPYKIALAFAAGGISGLVLAVISWFGIALLGVTPLLFDILAASLTGGLTSLLFPCCKDHQLIIIYLERAKQNG